MASQGGIFNLNLRLEVLAQTMAVCPKHSHTKFVWVRKNGVDVKVCEKCEQEAELYEDND